MAQARAAGIPVGQLYIVSRPLDAETPGTYDRSTGDICCHYEARLGEQGQRDVLQSLLILLAGIKLQAPLPQTIAQDWEQTRQAIEEGYALAEQWGYAHLFSGDEFTRLLTRSTELAYSHHLAAELAGSHSPWVARRAYLALQARRGEVPMLDTPERFTEALGGISADARANDAVVIFDRSLLRERWIVTASRPSSECVSYGELTVPFSPQSARLLRSALARAASWPHDAVSESARPSWSQEVCDEIDLAVLVRILNGWLIETHLQAAVRLTSWAYGDGFRLAIGSPRIYRLSLSYEDAPVEGPATRDLWVLFAAQPTTEQRALEAAWQMFLASWLTWSEMQCEPLAKGLQILWMLRRTGMTTTIGHRTSETTGQGMRVVLRVLLLIGDQPYPLGDAELACDTPAVRAWLAQAPLPEIASSLVTTELRQHIATLCERLGRAEPLYEQLEEQEARSLLARLQAEEEDLLQTAAQARTSSSSERVAPCIEQALIRQLKERWRARFRPPGSVDDLRRDWERFKQRVCGQEVSDRRMSANQYEQVLAALIEPPAERT